VLRCERLPRGRGYVIHGSGLLRPLPAGTDAASQVEAATIINATMERVIAEDPGQYLWGYNRYKSPRTLEATAEPAKSTPSNACEGHE
jgi:KDO2-lipid IV(A) lauroyltransferase